MRQFPLFFFLLIPLTNVTAHATSSKDLKQYPSVVRRLKQAAESAKQSQNPISAASAEPPLGNLSELTRVIDQQLMASKSQTLLSVSHPARDSMTAVISHNAKIRASPPIPGISNISHQIAIVCSKPQDVLSLEHAARVERLVEAMVHDGYEPEIVGFLGDTSTQGYQHLKDQLRLHNVTLNAEIYHIDSTIEDHGLEQFAQTLHTRVPQWKQECQNSPSRRVRLDLQFTLFSSEYHLCYLHDIHVRSPVQSPLRALEHTTWPEMTREHPYTAFLFLQTSWTYAYASSLYPCDDEVARFASVCYRRVQNLQPVHLNLRGVKGNREFFQRDNYRVLVQTRRSFVKDLESLYAQQPSLAAVQYPLGIVLERGVLALGRCLDLVRPAGLLTGTVPTEDFALAATILEQAITQLSEHCDPDRPYTTRPVETNE